MSLRLVHEVGSHIEVAAGSLPLARYTYAPGTAPVESPKPCLHPVRTLAGNIVTGFRPHDHVWHQGITLSFSHVNDQNFWGGPTYVRDQGYVQLDNNGAIVHEAWDDIALGNGAAQLVERLVWRTAAGRGWITEQRLLRICDLDVQAGCYALDIRSTLRNVSGHPLSLGSPTTHGRPDAGYGGWFWRGPRSFSDGGRVLSPGGAAPASAIMGAAAPWLAYIGRHDEVDAASTLVFIDHPTSARHPTKWFVRSEEFAAVSFALMFDEEIVLAPDAELALAHRIAIADGEWDPAQIERYVGAHLAQAHLAAN